VLDTCNWRATLLLVAWFIGAGVTYVTLTTPRNLEITKRTGKQRQPQAAPSRGRAHMNRELHHYKAVITGGPAEALVSVTVWYLDDDGEVIGEFYDDAMAFGYTWRDVAKAVRTGMTRLGLDRDPCSAISPHVDLT